MLNQNFQALNLFVEKVYLPNLKMININAYIQGSKYVNV